MVPPLIGAGMETAYDSIVIRYLAYEKPNPDTTEGFFTNYHHTRLYLLLGPNCQMCIDRCGCPLSDRGLSQLSLSHAHQ